MNIFDPAKATAALPTSTQEELRIPARKLLSTLQARLIMKTLLAIAAILGLAAGAMADEIILVSGNSLEGIVRAEDREWVTIEINVGTVSIPRSQVKEIRRGPCALTEYYERAERLSDSHDPEAHFVLAMWSKSQGLSNVAQVQLKIVLALDPDHADARLALGYRLFGGRWLTEDEYRAATGQVQFRGRWMQREERDSILAREAEERRAEIERKREEERLRQEREAALYRQAQEQARIREPGTPAYIFFPGYGYYYWYRGSWIPIIHSRSTNPWGFSRPWQRHGPTEHKRPAPHQR